MRLGIVGLLLITVLQLTACANTIYIESPLPVARSPELPKRWDINAGIKLPASKRIVIDRDDYNHEVQPDSFRGQMTVLLDVFIESSFFDHFLLGIAGSGRISMAKQLSGKSSGNAQTGNYSSSVSLELGRSSIDIGSVEDARNDFVLLTYSLGKRINRKLLAYAGLGFGYHDISFTNQPWSHNSSDPLPENYSYPGNSQALTFALQCGIRNHLTPHLLLARNGWKGEETEYDIGLGIDLIRNF